jgi:hypothetical protein
MKPVEPESDRIIREERPGLDLAVESSLRLSAKASRRPNRRDDSLLTEAEIEAAEEEAYAWAKRANSC